MAAAQTSDDERPVYFEPARSYATAWVLFVLLALGFVLDLSLGDGLSHLVAWVAAVVVVVGVDVLATHTARVLRSIMVTGDEVRVGEVSLQRSAIVGFGKGVDPSLPVLGRTVADGMPRGAQGLAVHLADGHTVVVATRHRDRLAAALEVSLQIPDIRPADPEDLALLPEIDERAESLFRVAGFDLPRIPYAADDLHEARMVFVAGRPAVGFARVDEVDGLAHVEDLAVLPANMRQGLGTALLEAACSWSAAQGYVAITLTTYADVVWNAPFYASRGFVETDEITPELAERRDWEHDMGLDLLGRRVVMRREL
jgi:ribosomal protein S18 acetylase RimI-like enzyme